MILYHPLSDNKDSNKRAIEKYQYNLVYVKIGRFNLWLTNDSKAWWQTKDKRKSITFKEALKLTKLFSKDSKIEYHFISELGDEKPDIKDFDVEDIYNCPTIKFNND